MDMLRFLTAGSVDDGKSTLIGRLLFDSNNILSDQYEAILKNSRKKGHEDIDLALLTDGLRAEREQGITIDVAYRYFATARRKFIVADAPGHIQYTRNMITGASNVSLVVILIDARHGVVEQTRRHSIIASILRIPQVVVAVNKMDLVGYDEQVFDKIVKDYEEMAEAIGLRNVAYIPISALKGDNVVKGSVNMPWYAGSPLLQYLEEVPVHTSSFSLLSRFQVQYVLRPQTEALHDYRGYAGRVSCGVFRKGDQVMVLPQMKSSRISHIEVAGEEQDQARELESIVIQLEDDIDISRGDYFTLPGQMPKVESRFRALACWLDENPLVPGQRLLLQHNSRLVKAVVSNIIYELDVNTLTKNESVAEVRMNGVAEVELKTASPLAYDPYEILPVNGSAILVDETGNQTLAALMLK